MNKKKRIITAIVIILISSYALYSWLESDWREPYCNSKIVFDSNEWKQNKDSRYCMLDNLVESKFLINKSKKELIELLGNPLTENKYFANRALHFRTNQKKDTYLYWYLFTELKNDSVIYVQKSLE